jgi:hypothetical protein
MITDPTASTAHASQRTSSWLFKFLLGASALFIAGCSAFFSVRGLGLLFIGSSTAVMIMAASLEIGKLVAASFLYRYWSQITIPVRFYLTLTVLVLIGITSLGNYGFLARAYESTHTEIASIEQQILPLQQDIDATQLQIDAARNQAGKLADNGREDRDKVQSQINQVNQDLDQSLARLEERRQAAKDRQDHDSQVLSTSLTEAAELLKKSLASEDEAIAKLNDRVAVLDRAVDAYTAMGGASTLNILKQDGIKKGQALRQQQEPERKSIAAEIIVHQQKQDQLRTDYAKTTDALNRDLAAAQAGYHESLAAFDGEEQTLRKNHDASVAKIEQQVAALQTQNKTVNRQGQDQIAGLYQRIESDQQEIARLRRQIANIDIGPYRFVARTFNAPSDDVVKWLILFLVAVFDPLAVMLTVGLNISLLNDRRAGLSRPGSPMGNAPMPDSASPARRRTTTIAGWIILLLLLAGGFWGIIRYGAKAVEHWRSRSTEQAAINLIPADSFLVFSLRPDRMQDPTGKFAWNKTVASLLDKTALSQLAQLFGGSLDANSDVYVFVKYPARQNAVQTQSPVLLCGLIARMHDSAIVEDGLDRFTDAFAESLRHGATTSSPAQHNMVRFGNGRYLDPQGGFMSFALTGQYAVLLLEVDGDPAKPVVEDEIRNFLTPATSDTAISRVSLPDRALATDAAISLWFDANRCFANMPKNSDAQRRSQQLASRLNFNLLLTLDPTASGQLRLVGDYNYTGERFKSQPQTSLRELLASLDPVDAAGVPGRLMDRCAATLDMEALMNRLPAMLAGTNNAAQIRIEKTINSPQNGRFELVAQYAPNAGAPLPAALKNLLH